MRKILIIFICFCLLFPVNIVLADKLVSQEEFSGFDICVCTNDCIAQGWKATDLQIDVTNISIYVNSTATFGYGVAGISKLRTPFYHEWLDYEKKLLSEMNGWVDFPNVSYSVTGGDPYWVLYSTLAPDENATVHGGLNNPYPNSTLWFREAMGDWVEQENKDMAFKIYGNEIVSPGVQTLNATHIEDIHAKLWGKILDDGGEDCKIRFEIKEDDGAPWYPSDWNGSYNTNNTFSEIVTGLDPGTVYLFRAGANNSRNITWADNWETFTTDSCDYIPEYHAVLFYPYYDRSNESFWKEDCDLLKSVLESYGWDIHNLSGEVATEENLISTLRNLSDDPWDTTLIVIASHGWRGKFEIRDSDSMMTYKNLSDNGVDYLKSCGIAIVIDACFSGSALWDNQSLKQDGRVIITCTNDTLTTISGYIERIATAFDDFADYSEYGDRNGAISMKEAYELTKDVRNFSQFWSGYPTEAITDELAITFQNWTTGRVDQITNASFKLPEIGEIIRWYWDNGQEYKSKVAQSFKQDSEKLTKVQINMGHWNDPTSPIKVEIRKGGDAPGQYYLGEKILNPDDFDGYVMFDFDDISNYTSGETGDTLFILCEKTDDSDPRNEYYTVIKWDMWDSYDRGCAWDNESPDPGTWNAINGDIKFVTYGLNSNMPPYLPKRPGGHDEGYACVSYEYNVATTDMDGDDVKYQIDWGDNTNDTTDWETSGDIIQVSHKWDSSGEYFIKVKAIDENLQESNWSDVYVVNISSNEPPNASTIDGPIQGEVGVEHNYTFNTTDPDGDNVSYYIKWGDGNITNWTAFQPSGTPCSENHTWSEQGTYNITAKAKDVYGAEGNWSTLKVKMPKNIFGSTVSNTLVRNIKNKITGSNFTISASGTADSITAYLQTNLSTPPKTKCLIYRNNDSTLIGATEEKILNTGDDGAWVTFNFSDPKPLVKDTEYTLACWSNDTCNLSYVNVTVDYGRFKNKTYDDATLNSTISWTSTEPRIYSIFCSYTTVPEITNVSDTPDTVGFGFNVTISTDIDDNGCGIDNATVNIEYPDNTTGNFTLDHIGNGTYQYVFSDTWLVGQYDYTIWAVDKSGSINSSSGHSFNVSAQATISVCTVKDGYGDNEIINLTDPPGNQPIGYELLDDGDVLRIWNKYDSYYFNTSSGIQLTNHYDEYWSHNVLMLGYYNNEEWNLIYRTDELSDFNKDIKTDNMTFVNATLWQDLTYKGYDFRLAIRYHLDVDDNELTVIPYIKNLGEAIPYTLGFGWEIKDIQIDMTPEGDYIDVNRTMYLLNQTLDNTYTDLSEPEFYLMENITGTSTRSLYLRWNQSLTYKLQVKSRDGQYNAPVTLFVRIGTLNAGQEKHTRMY